jgi:hypothetical protein
VSVPETFDGLGTLTVVGFDPAAPTDVAASAVATDSDTAYLSPTHLYVAASPWSAQWRGFGPMVAEGTRPTRIYGFDLTGTSAAYVGMGSVDGTVAGSWSMDEHDGVLRVAVSTSGALVSSRSSTSLVTLRPESGRLVDVGRVDGLGIGQQLKSVRWFDDIAVLVTFEQTDPFYVVDVADPAHPTVLGALHLSGWSSYLHPVGPHLVLGLGQTSPQEVLIDPPQPLPPRSPFPVRPEPTPQSPDEPGAPTATAYPVPIDPTAKVQPVLRVRVQRAKATLFDISDPTHPRDVDTVAYPAGSLAMAGVEPHQVTWLPDRDILLTVIGSGFAGTTYGGDRAWLSILTVHDDGLDSRLLPLPSGVPVNDVRTVPLDDGRVVVVAGSSVRFVTM